MNDEAATRDGSVESLVSIAADAYRERLRRGERPDLDAFCAEFPGIEHVLRRVLPALAALPKLDEGTTELAEPSTRSPIGDFAIRREIGRGGMGVVYEAEQLSLARRVALKVLPFASMLDPRHLQRFKNEAQAAGHLHHNHIVPVHAVGCERGVHYYAMQYIEGLSVAEIIDELRVREGREGSRNGNGANAASSAALDAVTSGDGKRGAEFCRTVARLGIQAAEALDHAHVQGVVHRDIKPGNLLVDGTGNLWITDFGLASVRGGETRSLTMSGDLLGTLRYMSPEQAMANRVPIDHRTDTYSLGATLYEFLTLEPAMAGKDSQQILQDIAFKDPEPARRLNPAVPDDLETILMKAMAKAPTDRYATAQELADDLRRFLEHKPIEAKRPGLVKRAAKWCSRHKAVVGTAIGVAAVALVGLSIGAVLLKTALDEKAAEKARAEANLERARSAVESMVNVAVGDLGSVSRTVGGRRKLLEEAVAYYESFLATKGDAPEVRREAADAFAHAGDVRRWLGDYPGAGRAYGRAVALNETLVEDLPDRPEHAFALAASLRNLGRVVSNPRDPDEGEALFARAADFSRSLTEKHPHEPRFWESLGDDHNDWGANRMLNGLYAESKGLLRTAIDCYERAQSLQGPSSRLDCRIAGSRRNLAIILSFAGRPEDAVQIMGGVVDVMHRVVVQFPDRPKYAYRLAETYCSLGVILRPAQPFGIPKHNFHLTGTDAPDEASEIGQTTPSEGLPPASALLEADRHVAAKRAFDAVRGVTRPLIADQPDAMWYRRVFCRASIHLALMQEEDGRSEEAMALMREAVATAPRHAGSRRALAYLLAETSAPHLRDVNEAVTQAEEATDLAPGGWGNWLAVGRARYRAGDWQGALEALTPTLKAADTFPDSHAFTDFARARAAHRMGDAAATTHLRQALRAAERAGPYYRRWLEAERDETERLLAGAAPR